MNITPQQQEDIRSVIWHNTKYRETFNEVYDHVLTAIEELSTEVNPNAMASKIIKDEFGDWDGIKATEEQRLKIIRKDILHKLWAYVKDWFSLPLIILTILAAVSVYYFAGHVPRKALFLVVFGIAMMPLPFWMKIAPRNRFSKKYKPSIKEGIAGHVATFGISILNCLLFLPGLILNNDNYHFFKELHIALITPIAVLYLVYGMSSVKVLKEDLKIGVVS